MRCNTTSVPSCKNACCGLGSLGGAALEHTAFILERGERVPGRGQSGLRLWGVLSGLVALSAGLPDGRRQIIELQAHHDVFCGAAFGDKPDGRIWAEALTQSQICALDFAPSGEAGRELTERLFSAAHAKLAASSQRMVTLGRLDGSERLCDFLAEMAVRIGQRRGASARLTLPMSREDIADYLGLNAETVSRILGRLKKSGLVRFTTPTELVLPDLAAVERRGGRPLTPHQHQTEVAA